LIKVMSELWSADNILETLRMNSDNDDFSRDVSVRRFDIDRQFFVGVSPDGDYLFGSKQVIEIPGFELLRAQLLGDQKILIGDSDWGRSLVLKCLVASESDALAISTLFSGLCSLVLSKSPENSVELAAQGFESYFSTKEMRKPTPAQELGLAGEMCVILSSSNPEKLTIGWHSSPLSTYDFSVENHRLEVKTSKSPQRLHWLRNSQSGAHADDNLTYASVYCPETENGLCVAEIVKRVETRLSMDGIEILRKKLAPFDYGNCETTFDITSATSTIHLVDSVAVPYPILNDSRILDARWKIDFSRLAVSTRSMWLDLIH
jgi:hypothetical protein